MSIEKTITKNIQNYIEINKFLREPKYFKNNYWSMAAWDSWAAQGKAEGCYTCSNQYYNGHLRNKRACTKRGGESSKYKVDISAQFCDACINRIHNILNTKFRNG